MIDDNDSTITINIYQDTRVNDNFTNKEVKEVQN